MPYFPSVSSSDLVVNGSTPTIVVGAIAGSGATYVINGNNRAGKVSITTGLGVGTSGNLAVMTLADGFVAPNGLICIIGSFSNVAMASMVSNIYVTTTNNTVNIVVSGVNLSVSTTYTFGYQIVAY